jgi:signal transduction histidine kinase
MAQANEINISLLLAAGTIGMLVMAIGVISFILLYQRKMIRQQVELQKMEAQYQRELLEASIKGQEKERKRLSDELHDGIGAMLSVTKLSLHQIEMSVKNKAESETHFSETKQLIGETIDHVRRISRDLSPATLEEFGLGFALEEFCSKMKSYSTINITFDKEETVQRFSPETELAIYRATQEVINNAIKHAEASEIKTSITGKGDSLQIQVTDNGKGFDVNQSQKQAGLGLKNIESRIHLVGGNVAYNSEKGKGTDVVISVSQNSAKH